MTKTHNHDNSSIGGRRKAQGRSFSSPCFYGVRSSCVVSPWCDRCTHGVCTHVCVCNL